MPTSDPDCAFCKVVAGNDPLVREVYRDGTAVAFFPKEPAVLGHTMVVPRIHVRDLWDVGPGLARELGACVLEVARAIQRAIDPQGLNVIQSNGAAAGQTVWHLHIHVVPRWEGDEVGPIWPPETHYTDRQKDAAWAAIRDECRRITPGT